MTETLCRIHFGICVGKLLAAKRLKALYLIVLAVNRFIWEGKKCKFSAENVHFFENDIYISTDP